MCRSVGLVEIWWRVRETRHLTQIIRQNKPKRKEKKNKTNVNSPLSVTTRKKWRNKPNIARSTFHCPRPLLSPILYLPFYKYTQIHAHINVNNSIKNWFLVFEKENKVWNCLRVRRSHFPSLSFLCNSSLFFPREGHFRSLFFRSISLSLSLNMHILFVFVHCICEYTHEWFLLSYCIFSVISCHRSISDMSNFNDDIESNFSNFYAERN